MEQKMCPKPQKQTWSPSARGKLGLQNLSPVKLIYVYQNMVTTTDVSCGLLCLSPFLNLNFINLPFV